MHMMAFPVKVVLDCCIARDGDPICQSTSTCAAHLIASQELTVFDMIG